MGHLITSGKEPQEANYSLLQPSPLPTYHPRASAARAQAKRQTFPDQGWLHHLLPSRMPRVLLLGSGPHPPPCMSCYSRWGWSTTPRCVRQRDQKYWLHNCGMARGMVVWSSTPVPHVLLCPPYTPYSEQKRAPASECCVLELCYCCCRIWCRMQAKKTIIFPACACNHSVHVQGRWLNARKEEPILIGMCLFTPQRCLKGLPRSRMH